jgi:hypothetical protein
MHTTTAVVERVQMNISALRGGLAPGGLALLLWLARLTTAEGMPGARSRCNFRERGTECARESGVKRMSGGAKQRCGRALGTPLGVSKAKSSRWRVKGVRLAQKMQAGL